MARPRKAESSIPCPAQKDLFLWDMQNLSAASV